MIRKFDGFLFFFLFVYIRSSYFMSFLELHSIYKLDVGFVQCERILCVTYKSCARNQTHKSQFHSHIRIQDIKNVFFLFLPNNQALNRVTVCVSARVVNEGTTPHRHIHKSD